MVGFLLYVLMRVIMVYFTLCLKGNPSSPSSGKKAGDGVGRERGKFPLNRFHFVDNTKSCVYKLVFLRVIVPVCPGTRECQKCLFFEGLNSFNQYFFSFISSFFPFFFFAVFDRVCFFLSPSWHLALYTGLMVGVL